MSGPVTLTRFARDTFAALSRAWSQVWFQDSPTSPLEIARIGIGAALLLHYALATPYLFDFWGDAGWMPRDVAHEDAAIPGCNRSSSILRRPWQWVAFHSLFLFCCAAFMVGWRTSWVKWIVLIGQISYDYRNPMPHLRRRRIARSPAADPVFRADRARDEPGPGARRARGKASTTLMPRLPPYTSPWAGACTRLMQIQMAVLFFYSGVSKTARRRLVERRRRMDWCSPPTTTTTACPGRVWHRTTGWSTSRPMARFSSRSPIRS